MRRTFIKKLISSASTVMRLSMRVTRLRTTFNMRKGSWLFSSAVCKARIKKALRKVTAKRVKKNIC